MLVRDRSTSWREDPANRLILYCALFTYILGLIARSRAYQDKLAMVGMSLALDTLIVICGIGFIKWLMRSKLSNIGIETFSIILAISVGLASVIVSGITLLRRLFPVIPAPDFSPFFILVYFISVFCIWGMLACWLKMQIRLMGEAINAAGAERAALNSELRRLRMQLDPHFLFNALNTALVEVNHQPKRAVLMLRELSNYLRYSLDTADVQFVPMAAELAMIRSFLKVQDIRFGAKLKFLINVEDGAKRRLIPTFLLQPLIENAVKYGVPDDQNVLHVEVAVSLHQDELVIVIDNTGDLALSKPAQWSTRTGLSNFHARLALHYPDRYRYTMEQVGEKVRVTCILKGEPC